MTFDPNMPQTPENVAKVLDVAGWTVEEAAEASNVSEPIVRSAKSGMQKMSTAAWTRLLDKAGRRAFDHDEDAA